MKEGLELLYQLQINDDLIKDLDYAIKEIPLDIQEVEKERDARASIIEESKKKLNENIKGREKLEKEIGLIKEKINKYKEQMNNSRTNMEYQGFISEIKYQEDAIHKVEEQIIEKMLESDEIMNEIRSSESEYNKIAEDYNKKIKDLKTSLEYNKLKYEKETKKRADLAKKTPDDLLKMYEKLFKQTGTAISLVDTEFCGNCNIKIRPQLLNDLISTDQIFICENCRRILFIKIEEEDQKTE